MKRFLGTGMFLAATNASAGCVQYLKGTGNEYISIIKATYSRVRNAYWQHENGGGRRPKGTLFKLGTEKCLVAEMLL